MDRVFFFFQAEDGIRDLVRSRGLGDVYKRQIKNSPGWVKKSSRLPVTTTSTSRNNAVPRRPCRSCLLYTSDAADERSSVDLGGRRIIKKKKKTEHTVGS
mgnify:CR=1 FL=1